MWNAISLVQVENINIWLSVVKINTSTQTDRQTDTHCLSVSVSLYCSFPLSLSLSLALSLYLSLSLTLSLSLQICAFPIAKYKQVTACIRFFETRLPEPHTFRLQLISFWVSITEERNLKADVYGAVTPLDWREEKVIRLNLVSAGREIEAKRCRNVADKTGEWQSNGLLLSMLAPGRRAWCSFAPGPNTLARNWPAGTMICNESAAVICHL